MLSILMRIITLAIFSLAHLRVWNGHFQWTHGVSSYDMHIPQLGFALPDKVKSIIESLVSFHYTYLQ